MSRLTASASLCYLLLPALAWGQDRPGVTPVKPKRQIEVNIEPPSGFAFAGGPTPRPTPTWNVLVFEHVPGRGRQEHRDLSRPVTLGTQKIDIPDNARAITLWFVRGRRLEARVEWLSPEQKTLNLVLQMGYGGVGDEYIPEGEYPGVQPDCSPCPCPGVSYGHRRCFRR